MSRFLRDGQEHTFDLAVTDQRAIVARAAVAPDPPYLDEEVNLAVVVATRAVDAEGIVRSTPVPGVRVELDGLGAWVLRTQDLPRGPLLPRDSTTTTEPIGRPTAVAFTDANGQARYELTCERAGPSGLSLLVSVSVTPPAVEGQPPPVPEQRLERLELALPECVDPASTVTSAPAAARGGGRVTGSSSHYDVLGIAPDADATVVRRAYLALARRHHPDSGGDAMVMRAVNEAWATLGDPAKRAVYDRRHRAPAPAPPTPPQWAPPAPEVDDDEPLRITVRLPSLLALLPAALFALSVGAGSLGMLLGVPALLALALLAFVLSTLLFLAAPFVALYASRRPTGGGR